MNKYGHFLDRAVELVKAGNKFVYVVDNIDWEEKVHDMRSSHQNKSVRAVATSMVFTRVPSN
jgi:predicted O-methyltransferase YrrM